MQTNKTPKEVLKELEKAYYIAESALVDHALEHNLNLYIEGKGTLLLEDHSYTYKNRGEWFTSTDSCN